MPASRLTVWAIARNPQAPFAVRENVIDGEICSCSALRQATRHLTRLYDAALAPAGLGINQYAILARLNRLGPMRVSDLAGRLVMDRSTLGHLLRPLEARGIVALHIDEHDRRSRLIGLTASGEALWGKAHNLWQDAETRFARAFGIDQARELRGVLKRLERISLQAPPS
jgi:DNA-binding MarR family transcriptional regulator